MLHCRIGLQELQPVPRQLLSGRCSKKSGDKSHSKVLDPDRTLILAIPFIQFNPSNNLSEEPGRHGSQGP